MFEKEPKPEPRKKVELGLQPRQVAIWFQNRRARWKSKHMEREYRSLKCNYDKLSVMYESLKEKQNSRSEVPSSSRLDAEKGFRFLLLESHVISIFDSYKGSVVEHTACLSEEFNRARGAFSVVLSGGSHFKFLRFQYTLDNVYAINDALSPEGAAYDYETCLTHLVKNGVVTSSERIEFPKFDVMLLGIGPDRHIASLFPEHPFVNVNKKWVTFIKDSPKPPQERITFTFPIINSSAYIALVVVGFGKAGAVHTAMVNGEDPVGLPVQMVSPEGE